MPSPSSSRLLYFSLHFFIFTYFPVFAVLPPSNLPRHAHLTASSVHLHPNIVRHHPFAAFAPTRAANHCRPPCCFVVHFSALVCTRLHSSVLICTRLHSSASHLCSLSCNLFMQRYAIHRHGVILQGRPACRVLIRFCVCLASYCGGIRAAFAFILFYFIFFPFLSFLLFLFSPCKCCLQRHCSGYDGGRFNAHLSPTRPPSTYHTSPCDTSHARQAGPAVFYLRVPTRCYGVITSGSPRRKAKFRPRHDRRKISTTSGLRSSVDRTCLFALLLTLCTPVSFSDLWPYRPTNNIVHPRPPGFSTCSGKSAKHDKTQVDLTCRGGSCRESQTTDGWVQRGPVLSAPLARHIQKYPMSSRSRSIITALRGTCISLVRAPDGLQIYGMDVALLLGN